MGHCFPSGSGYRSRDTIESGSGSTAPPTSSYLQSCFMESPGISGGIVIVLDPDPANECSNSYSWILIRPTSVLVHISGSWSDNECSISYSWLLIWSKSFPFHTPHSWILTRPNSVPVHIPVSGSGNRVFHFIFLDLDLIVPINIPGSWSDQRVFHFIFLIPGSKSNQECSSSYSWILTSSDQRVFRLCPVHIPRSWSGQGVFHFIFLYPDPTSEWAKLQFIFLDSKATNEFSYSHSWILILPKFSIHTYIPESWYDQQVFQFIFLDPDPTNECSNILCCLWQIYLPAETFFVICQSRIY